MADGKTTLAQQSGVSFIGNIAERLFGFIFLLVVTHLVSPTVYGTFVLGVSIVTFLKGITSLRMGRSLDYFIPMYLSEGEYGRARSTLLKAVLIAVLSSTLGAVTLWVLAEQIGAFFKRPELATVLQILSIVLVAGTANDLLFGSFNSIKRMEYRALTKGILRPGSKLLVTTVLVMVGLDMMGLIIGYIFSFVITAIVGVILLTRVDWILNGKRTPVSTHNLVSYSLPLAFAGIIYATVGQIDFFVIGYYLPSAEVGYYRVGFLFASNVLVIIASVKPIFKPMIAEATGSRQKIEDRFRLATRWITMFMIPVSITIAVAPDIYLELLFSKTYLPAATAVTVLVVGYLVNSAFGPEGMVLEGLGYTRLTLMNTVLIISTNFALDVLLVPRLGITGAAIGTAVGLSVGGIAGLVELYYLRGLHPLSLSLVKIWVAGIFGGIAGFAASTMVELSNIYGAFLIPVTVCGVYFVILILTKAFTDDDEKIAARVDNRLGRKILGRIINRQ